MTRFKGWSQFVNNKKSEKPKGKAKINQTKIEAFGQKFDSKMEYEFYIWLKSKGFDFEYKPKWVIHPLRKKSKINKIVSDESIHGMKVEYDFKIEIPYRENIRWYIVTDTKGFHIKKLKTGGYTKNPEYKYYMQRRAILRHFFYNTKKKNHTVVIVGNDQLPEFKQQLLDCRDKKRKGIKLTINCK